MNKYSGIRIQSISVYHPERVLDNEYYIKHFEKLGVDREKKRHVLEDIQNRDKRYVIDPKSDENSLTMAVKAAKLVLQQTGLSGKDIDMICLSSFSNEYDIPPTAMKINAEIGGGKNTICFDMNANCIGMGLGYEILTKYASANDKVKRILLIGSEYMTYLTQPDSLFFYGAFGDVACAVLLEKTNDEVGILDSDFLVDTKYADSAFGPGCGYSHMLTASPEEMLCNAEPTEIDFASVNSIILNMVKKQGLSIHDISVFCVSQFSRDIPRQIQAGLGVEADKVPYFADKYGYTGCTSPFLSLYESIKAGKIKRGDYVFLWTAGYAVQNIFVLFRY